MCARSRGRADDAKVLSERREAKPLPRLSIIQQPSLLFPASLLTEFMRVALRVTCGSGINMMLACWMPYRSINLVGQLGKGEGL